MLTETQRSEIVEHISGDKDIRWLDWWSMDTVAQRLGFIDDYADIAQEDAYRALDEQDYQAVYAGLVARGWWGSEETIGEFMLDCPQRGGPWQVMEVKTGAGKRLVDTIGSWVMPASH